MRISGNDIKEEYDLIIRALNEKFSKADDVSLSMGKFLEDAETCLSTMRGLYNKHAGDREQLVKPVRIELKQLRSYIKVFESSLQKHQNGTTEPEDNTRRIG